MKNAMQRLNSLILQKDSRICAGLDPTWEGIPDSFKKRLVPEFSDEEIAKLSDEEREELMAHCHDIVLYEYCVAYIEAVADIVPAIKINSAFFEKEGAEDLYWDVATAAKEMGLFVIGDVKRADIGSTSAAYADAYLGENSPFDAITINPYFGTDGVMPFMKLAKENGKGVFVLVKTSNQSSKEIQDLRLKDGRKVYEAVADMVLSWAEEVDGVDQLGEECSMIGAVVGATHKEEAAELTWKMDQVFFLVPGYGMQGATAQDVACVFDVNGTGAIVNSSRGIMQAYKKECWKDQYSEEMWAEAARAEAIRATKEINDAIIRYWDD